MFSIKVHLIFFSISSFFLFLDTRNARKDGRREHVLRSYQSENVYYRRSSRLHQEEARDATLLQRRRHGVH